MTQVKIPSFYKCSGCGASGVKLWRQAQTFLPEIALLCRGCGQKKTEDQVRGSDQIGWLLPAVPTPCGSTFWGYTSVPQDGCRWWNLLPPALPSLSGGIMLPTAEYVASLLEAIGQTPSRYLRGVLRVAYVSEVVRTGHVDLCRRSNGTYRLRGRTFRSKALARQWCERHRPPSVIDFRE